MPHDLLQVLVALVVFGAALYIVGLLPIDATIKRVIQVVAILALVIWVLRLLWPMMG